MRRGSWTGILPSPSGSRGNVCRHSCRPGASDGMAASHFSLPPMALSPDPALFSVAATIHSPLAAVVGNVQYFYRRPGHRALN